MHLQAVQLFLAAPPELHVLAQLVPQAQLGRQGAQAVPAGPAGNRAGAGSRVTLREVAVDAGGVQVDGAGLGGDQAVRTFLRGRGEEEERQPTWVGNITLEKLVTGEVAYLKLCGNYACMNYANTDTDAP